MRNLLETLRKNRETGFSLPELLVVVIIIGILAAIAIPIYSNQQNTATQAQVDTDLMNTAQSLSTWQQRQDDQYLTIPSDSVFQSQIVVKSDTATTLTLRSANWGEAHTRQFCVEANKNIGGTVYRVHYQLTTKVKATGACPAFVEEAQENYS